MLTKDETFLQLIASLENIKLFDEKELLECINSSMSAAQPKSTPLLDYLRAAGISQQRTKPPKKSKKKERRPNPEKPEIEKAPIKIMTPPKSSSARAPKPKKRAQTKLLITKKDGSKQEI